jgi:hypothetical protein
MLAKILGKSNCSPDEHVSSPLKAFGQNPNSQNNTMGTKAWIGGIRQDRGCRPI